VGVDRYIRMYKICILSFCHIPLSEGSNDIS
jgi:hypothetical protein